MQEKNATYCDHVDAVLGEWYRERPDINHSSTAILSRLGRLNIRVEQEVEALLERFGLSRAAYDVMATLRRKGAPFKQPQKALMQSLMRTSGTVTFRIDRLEAEGLVRREPDPDDRRGVLVCLTKKGLALFERVQPLHIANKERLLSVLSDDEQTGLVILLRKMLSAFERGEASALGTDDVEILERYGFCFAPERANETTGKQGHLRVGHVTPSSPAGIAGLRADDDIVKVNENSVTTPAQAIAALMIAGRGPLTLSVHRGKKLVRLQLKATDHAAFLNSPE
jgi:DNA-binding MarR family transcriptional regulator